jgi:hypothetical protein
MSMGPWLPTFPVMPRIPAGPRPNQSGDRIRHQQRGKRDADSHRPGRMHQDEARRGEAKDCRFPQGMATEAQGRPVERFASLRGEPQEQREQAECWLPRWWRLAVEDIMIAIKAHHGHPDHHADPDDEKHRR